MTVSSVRTSASGYRATFRLSAAASAGRLEMRVTGIDVDGGRNRTTLFVPME